MVNFNEILIIGIGLLSLGFLKGNREDPSVQTIGFQKEFVNPYLDKLQTATVSALNQLGTSEENLKNIKLNNLEIGQNILNIERQRADIDIDYIQSNLDEARSYLSEQQKISFPSLTPELKKLFNFGWTGKNLLNKFIGQTAYNQKVGLGSNEPIFPDLFITNSSRGIVAAAARYEKAQENIQKVLPFTISAEKEIINLNDQFNTKYGDISRYS